MSTHLDDGDLVALELLPDDAPDSRLHLATCAGCRSRLEIIRGSLADLRSSHEGSVERRDATLWKAQELRIMREVTRARRPASTNRAFAAAALLVVALGGFWLGRTSIDRAADPAPMASTPGTVGAAPSAADASESVWMPVNGSSTDPWEIESLSEFRPVVDWESWVVENGKDQGTI
jgi:hypothetical protein